MSYEYIPSITVGLTRYTHYPIRDMSRHEAETLLRHPTMRRTVIVRRSHSAQQEEPSLYYVMSYIPLRQQDPVHVIVTHESHDENISPTLPHPIDTYHLLLLPHHPAFANTRTEHLAPLYLAPRVPAVEDLKEEEPGAPGAP